MKPKEIAARLNVHLKRFERDPEINAERRYVFNGVERSAGRPYYGAWARGGSKLVHVTYIAYQGSSKLTMEEATAYLEWLDAGNVGTHYEHERAKAAAS